MYIFRLTEGLASSRAAIVDELTAAGVPASIGWYRPLYKNNVFQNAHIGPAHGIRSPLANKGVDYTKTDCPVCEQVCNDAVWIPQTVLLGSEADVTSAAQVIRHVIEQKMNG
jgi:dTDP-4-amino-4,6-dideoxygalactose transaminase